MKRYDPNLPVAGLHVPKTAGTSLKFILGQWFPAPKLLMHYAVADVLPQRQTLGRETCIYGHFNGQIGAGIWDYYPEITQHFAFFRDPFERCVSIWQYSRTKQAQASLLRRLRMRWRHLNSAKVRAEIFRPRTEVPFETWLQRRAEEQDDGRGRNSFAWHMPLPPGSYDTDRMLDETFVFVGLRENLAQSVDALGVVLGKPRVEVPYLNKTRGEVGDLSRWRPFFEKHFAEEMEFYEKVRARNAGMIAAIAS